MIIIGISIGEHCSSALYKDGNLLFASYEKDF